VSWQPCDAPELRAGPCDPVDGVLVPRERDLGGFSVRRLLPAPERRAIGPFVFLDQMGPAELAAGRGIDVRPHPHIGLATVTYLFEGVILHRDSLGSVQPIRPGDVNWMTAGRGIVHSERSDPELRKLPQRLFGAQAWVALPAAREEMAPAFAHHPASALPTVEPEGANVRVVAGRGFGARSPVETASELFYADAALAPGASLSFGAEHEERGIHVVSGPLEVAGKSFEAGTLLALATGRQAVLRAPRGARLLLLGGDRLDGPRHLWWNFVSSRLERIEQARADWRDRRFAAVPGETEFIPLPEK
jgi:redox-sensitive bicupin YhaK (pirin superfamily)